MSQYHAFVFKQKQELVRYKLIIGWIISGLIELKYCWTSNFISIAQKESEIFKQFLKSQDGQSIKQMLKIKKAVFQELREVRRWNFKDFYFSMIPIHMQKM